MACGLAQRVRHVDHPRPRPLDPQPRALAGPQLPLAITVERQHARTFDLDRLAERDLARGPDPELAVEPGRQRREQRPPALAADHLDAAVVVGAGRMEQARDRRHADRARLRARDDEGASVRSRRM